MSEEITTEEERQQQELRALIAGLSEHLDNLYSELEVCEGEVKKLREEIRASQRTRYLWRFWHWCGRTRRRLLGRSRSDEVA
jgi:CHAT domain-containing protein